MTATQADLLLTGGWTVDRWKELPEYPRYELIDGWLALLDRPAVYQFPLVDVCKALDAECPPDLLAVHRISLEVDARSRPCPDVVVLKTDHSDRSPVPIADAVLVFEVVPPDWNVRDLFVKETVYGRAGVPHYWLLDRSEPAGFTLMVLRPDGKGRFDVVESTHDVFTTTEPYPVTIDLPALTTRWRKRWERIRPRG
ncbi:Uma2 family endonuclease [Paractinoplanes durhamensis]|uniref:Putative restriction endonuclease domain-containing protein n=1 Tax=Paractinoplanes durhamensis TaxID=113563 RepID=A0ABQ3YMX1_9ACTN|nr:Uma2 family endonuclease [Actinoplanes durhamensis]GID98920.1 hypothetical protein Adu01nite_02710 [Actinoplanes durhamensis]